MIKAVIFDMDGVLIDSEPFWKESEIKFFNEIGVPLTVEMCETTVGMRLQEVTRYWYEKYPWDISKKSFEELEVEIINGVIYLIESKGKPMRGAEDILNFFRSKKLPLALASSSSGKIINAVMEKCRFKDFFEVIHSAENEKHSKPHPAIYINTAKMLNTRSEDCLAIEDSYNGLLSAKAAKMKTIAIPEQKFYDDSKFDIADVKLHKLNDFSEELFDNLNAI